MKFLLSFLATIAVVPDPIKGSKTIPFSGHPALIQNSGSVLGNIAECFSKLDSNGKTIQSPGFFPLGFEPFRLSL